MVLHNSDALGFKRITKHSLSDDDDKLCWDFMILDEVSLCACVAELSPRYQSFPAKMPHLLCLRSEASKQITA